MENKNIKVSVIMPVYNDELFIKETILSVLNQTHSNIELLIVDDCSSDKSIEIIKSFNDKRIKLFKNIENKGAAYSRNLAIANATGDYVAFLDGDDRWHLDKVEKQLNFMIQNNYDFSYTKYENFSVKENKISGKVTGPKIVTYRKFLRCDYIGCLTAMYKRDIIPNLQIPEDIKKRNDYALWLLVSQKSPCYLLDEFLAFYSENPKGISKGSKFKLIKFHYHMFLSLFKCSKIKAHFYAMRNVFYYVLKKMRYCKKA